MIAMLVLTGFVASLGLQALAQPDETPRAEIERLIGVDIAPAMDMTMSGDMAQCDDDGMSAATGLHVPTAAHHHHDAACALCPLLQLAAFILGGSVFLAFACSIRHVRIVVLPPGRGPPGCRWLIPPSQAPPFRMV